LLICVKKPNFYWLSYAFAKPSEVSDICVQPWDPISKELSSNPS